MRFFKISIIEELYFIIASIVKISVLWVRALAFNFMVLDSFLTLKYHSKKLKTAIFGKKKKKLNFFQKIFQKNKKKK